MKRGCPQGSPFGPVIWNLFQNDMAQQVTNSKLTLHADDHQMYKTVWAAVTTKNTTHQC